MNLAVPNVSINLKNSVNVTQKGFLALNAVRSRPSASFPPLVLRWPAARASLAPALAAAVAEVETVQLVTSGFKQNQWICAQRFRCCSVTELFY